MEAVGQLTGGLAHDFNNLLTGISGSLELLQIRISRGRYKDVERYISTAQGAANRAAALTHRLLAFSRRQTLDPKATDVNRLIGSMTDLINNTLGPEIAMTKTTSSDLWTTLVDPNQLENALLKSLYQRSRCDARRRQTEDRDGKSYTRQHRSIFVRNAAR